MLHNYISILFNKINDYLNSNFEEENILKMVNNIDIFNYINNDSKVLKKDSLKNCILMNICDIKLEDMTLNPHYYQQRGEKYIKLKKPYNFYIYIYLHSTFCDIDYLKGINYLSSIISYFHSNNSFNTENTNEIIENNLSEFDINIINDEENKFYSKLNIPYMPSFLIKIGLIQIHGLNNLDQTYSEIKNF